MEKLLLIDDEVDVQYSFRRIFEGSDIELHTASSGEEGLRLIPKVKPDLVLSDIRMAGLNGLETLRRIRQLDPQLPVILMTAYGTTQTAIEAMKLGAYDYLLKPFDVELAPSRSYYLLWRPGARRRPEIAAVADWLLAETASERHPLASSVPARIQRAPARRRKTV